MTIEIILLVLLILLGLAIAVSIFCIKMDKPNKYELISFKEAMALAELPVITFTHKGKNLNLILDTGANLSVIDKTIAKKIKLQPTGEKTSLTGMTETSEEIDLAKIVLTYNNKEYNDTVQIQDLSHIFNRIKKTTGVTVHGILGNSFMCNYQYTIDFKEMVAYSKGSKNGNKGTK